MKKPMSLTYENKTLRTRKMIEEIIELGERIGNKLDIIIAEEYRFAYEVSLRLEQMAWEQMRWVDEIKAIKERYC